MQQAQPLSTLALDLRPVWVERVTAALNDLFVAGPKELYPDYAKIICLLSDPTAVQGALARLDAELAKVLNSHFRATYDLDGDASVPEMVQGLDADDIVCDRAAFAAAAVVNPARVNVSVSKALRACFARLGVGKLALTMPSAVFSDAASDHFVPTVARGGLFVDGVTAGHGEFTHTIQWLLAAAAQQAGTITLAHDVGDLYRAAVGVVSPKEACLLFEKPGVDVPFEPKTMWDVTVDCFLTNDSKLAVKNVTPPSKKPQPAKVVGVYEFARSLYAPNFRSPRLLQYALFGGIPASEKRFQHHVGFLVKAGVPDAAPLLCALLRNRHRHKNLAVDMDEGRFQSYYSGRAAAKAERQKVRANKHGKHNPFLDLTGKNQDHASFIPTGDVKPPKK